MKHDNQADDYITFAVCESCYSKSRCCRGGFRNLQDGESVLGDASTMRDEGGGWRIRPGWNLMASGELSLVDFHLVEPAFGKLPSREREE